MGTVDAQLVGATSLRIETDARLSVFYRQYFVFRNSFLSVFKINLLSRTVVDIR